MGNRPTITDLAKAAGVSVATVDRVLNQRHPVRESTAERVLRAAEAIDFHATALIRRRLREGVPVRTFGFLLQKRADVFYQQLGVDLAAAANLSRLMLKAALIMNPASIILFSSKSSQHIQDNVDVVADAAIEAPARQLYILLQTEREQLFPGTGAEAQ